MHTKNFSTFKLPPAIAIKILYTIKSIYDDEVSIRIIYMSEW